LHSRKILKFIKNISTQSKLKNNDIGPFESGFKNNINDSKNLLLKYIPAVKLL